MELTLTVGAETFRVLRIEPAHAKRVVLFGVGAGGNPERHLGLIERLAAGGAIVVAPHFERLYPPDAPPEAIEMRGRRMRLALDAAALPGLPVAGVGHSIGAAMLLALSGGQMWTRDARRLAIEPDERLQRIVMMTPPTGFFRAPGALDAVHIPIMTWAGTADDVTPPEQVEFLRDALAGVVPFDLRLAEGAGHFSFMDVTSGRADPHPDQPAFVAELAEAVSRFVAA
jgi:pimeloyl-ACP methyl ester carboxylesterase